MLAWYRWCCSSDFSSDKGLILIGGLEKSSKHFLLWKKPLAQWNWREAEQMTLKHGLMFFDEFFSKLSTWDRPSMSTHPDWKLRNNPYMNIAHLKQLDIRIGIAQLDLIDVALWLFFFSTIDEDYRIFRLSQAYLSIYFFHIMWIYEFVS